MPTPHNQAKFGEIAKKWHLQATIYKILEK